MKGEPPLVRFYSKTERDPETGCLLWTGGKFNTGYGKFYFEGKYVTAHRWIFTQDHGYAPPVVRHDCDTPACVELKCLLPGTQADNVRDAIERDRFPRTGPTCKRGHSRWGRQANGSRRCLDCHLASNRRARESP